MTRVLLLGLLAAAPAAGRAADPVPLAETVRPGDLFRVEIALKVQGVMKVDRDGRTERLPLAAAATHAFAERVEAPAASGGIGKAVRHYDAAASETSVSGEKAKDELAADRRVIVAKRTGTGTLHYSPAGPLSRADLNLVADHFDTLVLPALLPPQPVRVNDTWPLTPAAAQHACLFDGVIKNALVGTLTAVDDKTAAFTVTGTAEGLDDGAAVTVRVNAKGTFDRTANRVVELVWEQADAREQGPASPATELTATVTLKRSPLLMEPTELAAGRAKLPADDAVPPFLVQLKYADPDGRYALVHPREWHVVGRTREHTVMRLVDGGRFLAQATLSTWKKAGPGAHVSPAEFRKVVNTLPGWEPAGAAEEAELPTDAGRWLFRLATRGKQDGKPVAQTFFLLAGPAGDQLAVTVLAPAEEAEKVGTRDVGLVNAVEFTAGKK